MRSIRKKNSEAVKKRCVALRFCRIKRDFWQIASLQFSKRLFVGGGRGALGWAGGESPQGDEGQRRSRDKRAPKRGARSKRASNARAQPRSRFAHDKAPGCLQPRAVAADYRQPPRQEERRCKRLSGIKLRRLPAQRPEL